MGTREHSAYGLVSALGIDVRQPVLDRLARRGLIIRETRKILGVPPVTRWPAADSRAEAPRDRVTAVLDGDADPDARTAGIIALVSASQVYVQAAAADAVDCGGGEASACDRNGRGHRPRHDTGVEGDHRGAREGRARPDLLGHLGADPLTEVPPQSGRRNTEADRFRRDRPSFARNDHCRIGRGTRHCGFHASIRNPKASAAMSTAVTPPRTPVRSAMIVRPDPKRAGMR